MRAIKTVIYCTLLTMMFSSFANAEITISVYRTRKETSEMKAHVWGIENGFGWANAQLLKEKKAPLYCEPPKVTITYEDLTYIIEEQATKLDKQRKLKSDTPIGLLLLLGLKEKFPCQT